MTADGTTPDREKEPAEQDGIKHVDTFEAGAHCLYGEGPSAMFRVEHVDGVDGEVFVEDSEGVIFAVESEDAARASTGIHLSPEQARSLADLLLRGARSFEEMGRSRDDPEEHRD